MENIQVCVLGSAILIFLVIYVCIFSGLFTIESFAQHPSENCYAWSGDSNDCGLQDHCNWDTDLGANGRCIPRDPFATTTTPEDVVDVCKAHQNRQACGWARRWDRPCRWSKPWDKSSDAERECVPNWANSSEFPVSDCNVKGGPNNSGWSTGGTPNSEFWENNEYIKSSCGGQTEDDCDKAMWYKPENKPTHGNCEWRGKKCRRRTHKNPRFNCFIRPASSPEAHPVEDATPSHEGSPASGTPDSQAEEAY